MAVTDYNTTPINNSTISGIDISEGCNPAGINNAIRQMMADVRVMYNDSIESSRLASVSALIDDTDLTYTAGTEFSVVENDEIYTKAEGYVYRVAAETATDHDIQTSNGTPVKLYVVADVYKPEMFSKMSTDAERAAGFNAAMQKCVADQKGGTSSGDYEIDATITPGGAYSWDWTDTRLLWAGSDITTLTEVLENPDGTTAQTGSGKYVLFDTAGCEGSTNRGSLTIRGVALGNFTMASRALVEDDLVALTASDQSSAGMTWERLELLGCGNGLWQGDQRGTGQVILPYTRWSVRQLQIKFCKVAITGGPSGNGFDDGDWGTIRLTRNANNGTIRTDFVCNSIFLNGMLFDNANPDKETQTVATTADDPDVILSAANSDIVVGTIMAIEGASNNLDSSETTGHVSRVSAVSGTTITLETAPENTIAAAAIILDPPQFLMANGELIAQHVYAEETHDVPLRLSNNGKVIADSFKPSSGRLDSRYNVMCPAITFSGFDVDVSLNQRGEPSNTTLKGIIGIPVVRDGDTYPVGNVHVESRSKASDFVKLSVIRGFTPESDHDLGGDTPGGIPGTLDQYITVRYANGEQAYHVYKEGPASELLFNNGRGYNMGDSLTGDSMSTMTATGNFAIASGVATKTAGASGTVYFPVSGMSPDDQYMVEMTCDTFTTTGAEIQLFDSSGSGTGAGSPELAEGINIRAAGPDKVKIVVPEGSGADRIGIRAFANADIAFSRFRVRKLT